MLYGKLHEQRLWDDYWLSPTVVNSNALAEYYLPLVRHVALKLAKHWPTAQSNVNVPEIEEMVADAFPALRLCIERFDPAKNCSFTTYVLPRVRGAILDAMRSRDWVPRLERARAKNNPEHRLPEIVPIPHRTGEQDTYETQVFVCHDAPKDTSFWASICKGMSKVERLLFIQYYQMDLTLKQSASSLGFSESRASQLMTGIHKRLRERFASDPSSWDEVREYLTRRATA